MQLTVSFERAELGVLQLDTTSASVTIVASGRGVLVVMLAHLKPASQPSGQVAIQIRANHRDDSLSLNSERLTHNQRASWHENAMEVSIEMNSNSRRQAFARLLTTAAAGW